MSSERAWPGQRRPGASADTSEEPLLLREPGVSTQTLPSVIVPRPRELVREGLTMLPALVARAGEHASRRFLEFFSATIRNKNTRLAYAKACGQFLAWCEERGIERLQDIEPMLVAAYIEKHPRSVPTAKQHLAAIRMLFDWLVIGQILATNPAHSVRGPKHVVSRGKTPVLDAEQARKLLDSIPLVKKNGSPDVAGLRDRALIGVMVFSFARVSAAAAMRVEDYYQDGKRWWFRLHEKGGKRHMVPAHHSAEQYLDEYLAVAGDVTGEKKWPLFRTIDSTRELTTEPMTRNDVLRMVKRRAKAAELPASTCCHTFRATGITAYMENGGTLEKAQAIAAHSSPRTTKLYDRTSDEPTLDEVERIRI
jgi:integrase/recombinase XerD